MSLSPPTAATAPDTPAWLRALGAGLAEALPRLYGEDPDPLLGQLIAALGEALQRGELELGLAGPPPEGVEAEGWPERHRECLAASVLCREPDGPLVLLDQDPPRLGWRRWQRQRQEVLQALLRRAQQDAALPGHDPAAAAAAEPLESGLDPAQSAAVAAVLRRRLVLLEGGPGTGKTSTVAAMLRAVRQAAPEARIHLAAPTGKAAARLRAAAAAALPSGTLHRLLESRGDHFARNRRQPLGLDLLVVDEVSMVDLGLMAATLEALPDTCGLVLVGDPCQLPPVAPGAVLHDLQRAELRVGLGPALHTLTTTYRNDGAIAAVAAALRHRILAAGPNPAGAGAAGVGAALEPLADLLASLPADANLRCCTSAGGNLPAALLERLERQRHQLADLAMPASPEAEAALLRQLQALLVLTPLRRGRWGVEGLHRRLLGDSVAVPLARWPLGTPVLCSRNLPDCGLANGDLGVLIREPEGGPRVVFPSLADGQPLRLHPAQLTGAAEPAFALTVHKAQGSEAEEVHVLLPPGQPPDPRLLYTALTRARGLAVLHQSGQRIPAPPTP